MKRPSFLEGVVVAAAASAGGGVLATALTTSFAAGWVIRVLVAGLGLAYVLYLLARSRQRIGRITALAGWAIGAVGAWWMSPSLAVYLLAHLVMVWLVRALYHHAGVLPALADLGLTGLGLAAAVWAAVSTGSVFASIWCFFLVQAAFVLIPPSVRRRASFAGPSPDAHDAFLRAHRAAERAVARITSTR
jgi:hypothetical protein